jgi:osmotically-inducible protein OsmY
MKKTILILSLLVLTSCVETVVVSSVATGVMLSREEKVSDTISDISKKDDIKDYIAKYEEKNHIKKKFDDINVSVVEGRVLLTGTVDSKKYKEKIYKTVWGSKVDISEVINEVKISRNKKRNKIKDKLITSQIKTKFRAKQDIKSFNYNVFTVDNTVYLFGIAQDSREMRLTANVASRVKGVNNVVSHVILKSDSRR